MWVQVKNSERGDIGSVSLVDVPAPFIVDRLRDAVKVKWKHGLAHCDASELQVFPPGTTDLQASPSLRPSVRVPTNTTDESPLIVRACIAASEGACIATCLLLVFVFLLGWFVDVSCLALP